MAEERQAQELEDLCLEAMAHREQGSKQGYFHALELLREGLRRDPQNVFLLDELVALAHAVEREPRWRKLGREVMHFVGEVAREVTAPETAVTLCLADASLRALHADPMQELSCLGSALLKMPGHPEVMSRIHDLVVYPEDAPPLSDFFDHIIEACTIGDFPRSVLDELLRLANPAMPPEILEYVQGRIARLVHRP